MSKLSHRHHYLPQFYLRGFGDEEERLWVFDREERIYRQQGTTNIAVQKDFYTVTKADGQKSDQIEKGLSQLESDTKKIVERLDRREATLEAGDRYVLALFIAFMRNRTTAFDKDQSKFTEDFLRWRRKAGHPGAEAVAEEVQPQQVSDMDREEMENPRQNNIRMMLDLSLQIVQALMTLNWHVHRTSKESSFITCDNPFTLVPPPNFVGDPRGYGILTPDATTLIPLSRRTCISFFGEGDEVRYAIAPKGFVRHVNYVVAGNADRFVLAREKLLLESVVRKTKLGDWRRSPSIQFDSPAGAIASVPPTP